MNKEQRSRNTQIKMEEREERMKYVRIDFVVCHYFRTGIFYSYK
jgi:hypothetical protein